ncbi:hypothetical protein AYO49_06520 [Verrucomicrobiaceae bacterium SCGC AG-212-N21]|nr:hypothetical protein AYO49_06520 [Verrucomicrobiaceae bacterium SCGC AG-212-N21]
MPATTRVQRRSPNRNMKPNYLLLFFCLVACVCFAQTTPAPKPPLSAPKDAKLFNRKWYAVFQEKVSWSTAREKCERMGGQLVVVHDKLTWDYVAGLTQVRVWLGASDEKLEGEWVWVDGKKMTFTAWADVNPTNSGGKEHYLSFTPKSGQWNDVPKDWDYYKEAPIVGYICEWEAR